MVVLKVYIVVMMVVEGQGDIGVVLLMLMVMVLLRGENGRGIVKLVGGV